MMILETGAKVLTAHRRLFPNDHGRYFVGTVEAYDAGIVRIEGHTWLRDGYDGTFQQKADLRTKIVSITSGSVIVYQLPSTIDLPSFHIDMEMARTVARDDQGFEMDLSEGVFQGGEGGRSGRSRVA